MSTNAVRLTGYPGLARKKGVASITGRQLRDMAVDGLLPAFQINHLWYYNPADFDKITAAILNRKSRGRVSDLSRSAA